MDPRIREHAEILVDWSARVEPGDRVIVQVDEAATPLAIAVAEKLAEREASMLTTYQSGSITRAYLQAFPDAAFPDNPEHEHALYAEADVILSLGGGTNTSATADVPGERRQAYAKSRREIREARYDTDWVSTVHPTPSLAQQASMATEEYRDFAYGAIIRDWQALADEMANLKNRLDAGSTVRIEAPGTDLTMAIDDRTAVNSAASVAYDSHNLPSGEVFTAPYATEGEITFDVPMTIYGQPIRDVWLKFKDGEVVDFDAVQGQGVIAEILETDEGAKRLGELGIGMNREIDRYTDNILFDEKMGDTIHCALGRAYDACLPEGQNGNESAVHVDMITDVSRDSQMSIDGEVIQRNGKFEWEAGFNSR